MMTKIIKEKQGLWESNNWEKNQVYLACSNLDNADPRPIRLSFLSTCLQSLFKAFDSGPYKLELVVLYYYEYG